MFFGIRRRLTRVPVLKSRQQTQRLTEACDVVNWSLYDRERVLCHGFSAF